MAKEWKKIVEEHKAKLAKANAELAKTKAETEAKSAWWAHFHNDPRPGEEISAEINRLVASGQKPPAMPQGERPGPIEETTDILPGGKAVSMPFADFTPPSAGAPPPPALPSKPPPVTAFGIEGDPAARQIPPPGPPGGTQPLPPHTAGSPPGPPGGAGHAAAAAGGAAADAFADNEEPTGEPGEAEEAGGHGMRPTPSPAPQAGGTEMASIFRNIGSVAGWAIGAAGGPIGASLGQMIGGWAGELAGGGRVSAKEIAGSLLGVAGGAAAGGVGAKLGGAIGQAIGMFGEQGGGEEGGAINVGGGGTSDEGSPQEMVRLLREISMNIRSLVGDGIVVRGDHRRTGSSII